MLCVSLEYGFPVAFSISWIYGVQTVCLSSSFWRCSLDPAYSASRRLSPAKDRAVGSAAWLLHRFGGDEDNDIDTAGTLPP